MPLYIVSENGQCCAISCVLTSTAVPTGVCCDRSLVGNLLASSDTQFIVDVTSSQGSMCAIDAGTRGSKKEGRLQIYKFSNTLTALAAAGAAIGLLVASRAMPRSSGLWPSNILTLVCLKSVTPAVPPYSRQACPAVDIGNCSNCTVVARFDQHHC